MPSSGVSITWSTRDALHGDRKGIRTARRPRAFRNTNRTRLVPIVAIVVTLYGVLGGIAAAYWTDLIQGFCIILLSVLLIPFGLHAVVEKFGSPGDSWTDGFRVMHEQLPADNFTILGGDAASEFPLYAIVVIVIMNIIGIVLTPHFIVTGGGTAKSEQDARIGLVTGNFIKRFCTIGWVITALIVLTLFGMTWP